MYKGNFLDEKYIQMRFISNKNHFVCIFIYFQLKGTTKYWHFDSLLSKERKKNQMPLEEEMSFHYHKGWRFYNLFMAHFSYQSRRYFLNGLLSVKCRLSVFKCSIPGMKWKGSCNKIN